MKLKVALFDLDGTLADSIPLHFEAVRAVFSAQGLPAPDPIDFWRTLKPPFEECYSAFGSTLSPDEIWKIYNSNIVGTRVKLFSDALPVVQILSKLMAVYVVSAGPVEDVRYVCENTGLAKHVAGVEGGHEFKFNGVQKILDDLSIPPHLAMYVSDFAPEVRELKASYESRLPIFGVTTGISREEDLLSSGAEKCFGSLGELCRFVLS